MRTIIPRPTTRPMTGASGMNSTILRKLPTLTIDHPALATPAPTNPPMRACDDEVGSPKNHVITSQAIAPNSAPNRTASLTADGLMVLPMVLATATPNTRNATKLNEAAHITANRGDSTRVDTTVAIELAESCQPLA